MTTTTNRLKRLESYQRAMTLGRDAALIGGTELDNPYNVGSWLWCVWGESFDRTQEEIEIAAHDLAIGREREQASQALAAGRLAEHEREADAKERQGSLWAAIVGWLFNTRSDRE